MKKSILVLAAVALVCMLVSGCGLIRQVLQTTSPKPDDSATIWTTYVTGQFSIALPERWKAVDIDKEGYDAVIELIAKYDRDWADGLASSSEQNTAGGMVFWAMDTQEKGSRYASFNITRLATSYETGAICDQLAEVFEKNGAKVVDNQKDLMIDGLKAGRLELTTDLIIPTTRISIT